jgi:hypothetical protein
LKNISRVRFNSLDPHAIRATRQVSGHDFSVLHEPSEAMRKQRSRAVQALKKYFSLRRRPARSETERLKDRTTCKPDQKGETAEGIRD